MLQPSSHKRVTQHVQPRETVVKRLAYQVASNSQKSLKGMSTCKGLFQMKLRPNELPELIYLGTDVVSTRFSHLHDFAVVVTTCSRVEQLVLQSALAVLCYLWRPLQASKKPCSLPGQSLLGHRELSTRKSCRFRNQTNKQPIIAVRNSAQEHFSLFALSGHRKLSPCSHFFNAHA